MYIDNFFLFFSTSKIGNLGSRTRTRSYNVGNLVAIFENLNDRKLATLNTDNILLNQNVLRISSNLKIIYIHTIFQAIIRKFIKMRVH